MDLHSSQIVVMCIGASFFVFAIMILKYNMRRKSKRVNHKTPSGAWFITGLALTGALVIYYGWTLEVPDGGEVKVEQMSGSLDDLANETFQPEASGGGFLEAVSQSAKKKAGQ